MEALEGRHLGSLGHCSLQSKGLDMTGLEGTA